METPAIVRFIDDGKLRHVEGRLAEHPLGVVRLARAAAQEDAALSAETSTAVEQIAPAVADVDEATLGEELVAAMETENGTRRFFDILDRANALEYAYPELAALRDVPAGPSAYHKEGDSYEHTMQVLTEMEALRATLPERFAAIAHDLGKAETPSDRLPSHYGHAKTGEDVAAEMAERLRLPEGIQSAMAAGARLHMKLHDMDELNATTIIDMADTLADSALSTDGLIDLGRADRRGREPQQAFDNATEAAEALDNATEVLEEITVETALSKRGYAADAVGEAITAEQAQKLARQDRAEAFRELQST